jgi:predicted aspartyl protease
MGLTKVTTKITGFTDGHESYEAVFLVDTGATDSMVPAPELDRIGLRRKGKMAYELASGEVPAYAYGLGPHSVHGRDHRRDGHLP